MKLNPNQAHDDAVQDHVRELLSKHGPMYCGQIARAANLTPKDARWHLTELVALGEADFNWVSGLYSV